jgi:hypothetical protein
MKIVIRRINVYLLYVISFCPLFFVYLLKIKSHIMKFFKTTFMLTGLLVMSQAHLTAQATMSDGPALQNDRDSKMNRLLKGDGDSFYAYRVRSKGKGTSFFVEKYNKASLKPEFSKEINLGDDEKGTKIEDVEYASGNVFIFRRQYDKKNDKMTLFFQTVSSAGVVSKDVKEITTIVSDHYEFVDFDIFANPSQTKFVVKASHKANKKDSYKTDFILIDAVGMKKLWTKTVDQQLHGGGVSAGAVVASMFLGGGIASEVEGVGFLGLLLDDKDNIYWGYNGLAKTANEKEKRYRLNLYTLNAGDQKEKKLELTFDDDYLVSDIEFSKTKENEIVMGGFIKDVIERRGRDLVKCGIFSFKINIANNTVAAKTFKFFDDNMLKDLESSAKKSRYYKYKLDYIIPVGDAVYYVGEQYKEQYVSNNNNSMGSSGGNWTYEYMDVIIAKLNSKGEFEWIKNSPLRNQMSVGNIAHVFKQYIAFATTKNLYILNDDHPKNIERYNKQDFEPSDLKSVKGIHGSNFVCNAISLLDGKVINRIVLMKNEDYCFAPIQERNMQFVPPSDCEIFVPGDNNEIYIYTEDAGRDRFSKIKFD